MSSRVAKISCRGGVVAAVIVVASEDFLPIVGIILLCC
jgi:hypothetical protein